MENGVINYEKKQYFQWGIKYSPSHYCRGALFFAKCFRFIFIIYLFPFPAHKFPTKEVFFYKLYLATPTHSLLRNCVLFFNLKYMYITSLLFKLLVQKQAHMFLL